MLSSLVPALANAAFVDLKRTHLFPYLLQVQILDEKVDFSNVQSRCGSKNNIKHVPGLEGSFLLPIF